PGISGLGLKHGSNGIVQTWECSGHTRVRNELLEQSQMERFGSVNAIDHDRIVRPELSGHRGIGEREGAILEYFWNLSSSFVQEIRMRCAAFEQGKGFGGNWREKAKYEDVFRFKDVETLAEQLDSFLRNARRGRELGGIVANAFGNGWFLPVDKFPAGLF